MRGNPQALWLALPIVAALFAHAPSLDNGFVNWDDPYYLLNNPLVAEPLSEGVGELVLSRSISYPVPVTVVSYAAQHRLFENDSKFGLDPGGFHAVSLALHALVALLAALVARRFGASYAAAGVATAIFAVHPMTVEGVAWVVGQKDLLAAVFALSAIVVRAGPRGDDLPRTALVAVLAVLAIGSKPSAVAVPALLLGVDLVRSRSVFRPRALALYGALGAIGLVDIALSISGHEASGISPTGIFGTHSLAVAAWAYALQVGHVFAPVGLLARYYPPTGAWLAVNIALGVALLALTAVGAVIAWRRGARAIAFGLGGAVVAYLPVSGLMPLPRGPADVYMYLPLALTAVALACGMTGRFDGAPRARQALLAAAATAAIALGAVGARAQTLVWHDSLALWRAGAVAYPDEPRAVADLGSAMLFEQRLPEALTVFEDVSERFPDYTEHLPAYGDTLMQAGQLEAAERIYARAARAEIRKSDDVYALFLIGRPALEPTDPEIAKAALRAIAPELAERGKRPTSLDRAAVLLDRYGEPELAASIRERAAFVRRRDQLP